MISLKHLNRRHGKVSWGRSSTSSTSAEQNQNQERASLLRAQPFIWQLSMSLQFTFIGAGGLEWCTGMLATCNQCTGMHDILLEVL
jgi:hypothetical protein